MSGHTFKVGDRVRPRGADDKGTVVAVLSSGWAWVVWDRHPDEPTTEAVSDLSPLPLFEPVERWMLLRPGGGLGWTVYSNLPGYQPPPDDRYVRVRISPAEDPS